MPLAVLDVPAPIGIDIATYQPPGVHPSLILILQATRFKSADSWPRSYHVFVSASLITEGFGSGANNMKSKNDTENI